MNSLQGNSQDQGEILLIVTILEDKVNTFLFSTWRLFIHD